MDGPLPDGRRGATFADAASDRQLAAQLPAVPNGCPPACAPQNRDGCRVLPAAGGRVTFAASTRALCGPLACGVSGGDAGADGGRGGSGSATSSVAGSAGSWRGGLRAAAVS